MIVACLQDVEVIADKHGYASVSGSEVLLESNSSSLQGGRWLTRGMGRAYSPKPLNPRKATAFIVEAHVIPPVPYEAPILVLAHVDFGNPLPPSEVRGAYSGSEWVASVLKGKLRADVDLSNEEHATVLPGAKTLRAVAVPLVEMVDVRTVSEHVNGALERWSR